MNKALAVCFFVITTLSVYAYTREPEQTVGAALPQTPAGFETSLAAPITSSATSMTLTANSTRGGNALSGYNCFSIDIGSAQAEYICGTVSGTTVSSMTRGIDDLTGTTTNATLQFSHRRGASVQVTDFPAIQILRAQANGQDTFPNLLTYANTVLISVGAPTTTIATKYYVDTVAVAGASNSDTTTKGIVEIATAAEVAAGTAAGGTGALLVAPNSLATSTPTASCTTACIVAAVSGKIAQAFIKLTELFTFTGGLSSTGTTTISAASTTTNPLVLNGRAYSFQAGAAASSSVLTIDINGNTKWATSTVRAIFMNTPHVPSANASTTHATVVIPPGTLGVNTSLRYDSLWRQTAGGGNCLADVLFGNGTASTSLITMTISSNINAVAGTLMATSTTGQVSNSYGNTGGAATYSYSYGGYNLANTTYLTFVTSFNGASTCSFIGGNVEIITQ